MKLYRSQVGSILYIYDDFAKEGAERKMDKIMKETGEVRIDDDGTESYYDDVVILDLSQKGSAMYIWDKSGNKVKHQRFKVIKKRDKVIRQFIGTIYKLFE